MLSPPTSTPALANANTGRIANATHGCSECSSVVAGAVAVSAGFLAGTKSAVTTPASVACTPDFSTQSHNAVPTRM